MEFKCEICNKKFGSQESLAQHSKMSHVNSTNITNKKSYKKYFLIAMFAIAVLIIGYTFYVKSQMPGKFDDFAKCLSEKGAVIYGNDFCQYTNKQVNMFGNSKKYLSYVKCIDNEELCDEKGVKITPTWEINGEMYEQVQSFDRLSALSGCEI